MKLRELIQALTDVGRAYGDIDIVLYDGQNEEWDIDHVDVGWSKTFRHHYAVVCTGNHEEGSEPCVDADPPEPSLYERGELALPDTRTEHNHTL